MAVTNANLGDNQKIVLWADGTWCWLDDFRPADYTHMSDDYEIIDMGDMPSVDRIGREMPHLHHEIVSDLT